MKDAAGVSVSSRPRTGATVLSLLAGPLCVPILRAHLEGPLRLPDLGERIGDVSQPTLRGQVDNLRKVGALERQVRGGMPYTVENELTEAGHEILTVAEYAEAWLARAPQGPIVLGGEPARSAIRSLIGGWSSAILRALAARPLTLTELDDVIVEISYPSLERRLSAMRSVRQVEAVDSEVSRAKSYVVTEWTRHAVGPLMAASHCERQHLSAVTEPPTPIDIEAALLLALPLARLPVGCSGSCLLAVDTNLENGEAGRGVAGVQVEIWDGVVTSCSSRSEQQPRTWAHGKPESWLDSIVGGRHDGLHIGEASSLARTVITALHACAAP
jgi:DNA-binding HxlR family transcriptional regulator